MNRLTKILFALLGCFVFIPPAGAQPICPGLYDRADREVILQAEVGLPILERMAELAEMSASSVYSQTQRMALSNEYEALKGYIGNGLPLPNVTPQTNAFLSTLLDANYLGIQATSILGASVEESQQRSRDALNALNTAILQAHYCTSGSWERVELRLSQYNGQCGGGFHPLDIRLLVELAARTDFILARLTGLAHAAATGVQSVNQRTLENFNFEYLREGIELIGEGSYRQARPQSRRFIRQVLDSGYLGIAVETIGGATIDASQANARHALQTLATAQRRLLYCLAAS